MNLYVVFEEEDWEEDSTVIKGIFNHLELAKDFSKKLDTTNKTNWIETHILNQP